MHRGNWFLSRYNLTTEGIYLEKPTKSLITALHNGQRFGISSAGDIDTSAPSVLQTKPKKKKGKKVDSQNKLSVLKEDDNAIASDSESEDLDPEEHRYQQRIETDTRKIKWCNAKQQRNPEKSYSRN